MVKLVAFGKVQQMLKMGFGFTGKPHDKRGSHDRFRQSLFNAVNDIIIYPPPAKGRFMAPQNLRGESAAGANLSRAEHSESRELPE